MAQRKYYYRYEDAEQLKQTFQSWVNKVAQTGNGEFSVLKNIDIKQKKTIFQQDPSLQTYSVEFQFVNSKAIDSSHFFLVNGLNNVIPNKPANKSSNKPMEDKRWYNDLIRKQA
jgi:hypothetical protein